MAIYPPPGNLLRVKSPKLNAEINLMLSESMRKRDERLVKTQIQLAAAITALGRSISIQLDEQEPDTKILTCTTDAAKLLNDAFYNQVKLRRSLILPFVDQSLKQTLEESPFDEWLFGSELSERIRSVKTMQQTSSGLKPTPVKKHLNFKSLPRATTSQKTVQGYQGRHTTSSQNRNYQQRPAYKTTYRSSKPSSQSRSYRSNNRRQQKW